MSGFCRWYEKDMEDITEHEQEQCEENGQEHRRTGKGHSEPPRWGQSIYITE